MPEGRSAPPAGRRRRVPCALFDEAGGFRVHRAQASAEEIVRYRFQQADALQLHVNLLGEGGEVDLPRFLRLVRRGCIPLQLLLGASLCLAALLGDVRRDRLHGEGFPAGPRVEEAEHMLAGDLAAGAVAAIDQVVRIDEVRGGLVCGTAAPGALAEEKRGGSSTWAATIFPPRRVPCHSPRRQHSGPPNPQRFRRTPSSPRTPSSQIVDVPADVEDRNSEEAKGFWGRRNRARRAELALSAPMGARPQMADRTLVPTDFFRY